MKLRNLIDVLEGDLQLILTIEISGLSFSCDESLELLKSADMSTEILSYDVIKIVPENDMILEVWLKISSL